MNRVATAFVAIGLCSAAINGCYSGKAMSHTDEDDLISEGSVVFEETGGSMPWLGSGFLKERFEVVYERFSFNSVGMPVVEVGIRYRGGVSWLDWCRDVPQMATLGAKCNFYSTPSAQAGGPVLYSTNRERLQFRRGDVYAYRAICPVRSAKGYQLVLGE